MVAHALGSSTWESEAGASEFKVSFVYYTVSSRKARAIERLWCLKNKQTKIKTARKGNAGVFTAHKCRNFQFFLLFSFLKNICIREYLDSYRKFPRVPDPGLDAHTQCKEYGLYEHFLPTMTFQQSSINVSDADLSLCVH